MAAPDFGISPPDATQLPPREDLGTCPGPCLARAGRRVVDHEVLGTMARAENQAQGVPTAQTDTTYVDHLTRAASWSSRRATLTREQSPGFSR